MAVEGFSSGVRLHCIMDLAAFLLDEGHICAQRWFVSRKVSSRIYKSNRKTQWSASNKYYVLEVKLCPHMTSVRLILSHGYWFRSCAHLSKGRQNWQGIKAREKERGDNNIKDQADNMLGLGF